MIIILLPRSSSPRGVYTIETLELMLYPRNRKGRFFSVCDTINEGGKKEEEKKEGKTTLLQ